MGTIPTLTIMSRMSSMKFYLISKNIATYEQALSSHIAITKMPRNKEVGQAIFNDSANTGAVFEMTITICPETRAFLMKPSATETLVFSPVMEGDEVVELKMDQATFVSERRVFETYSSDNNVNVIVPRMHEVSF